LPSSVPQSDGSNIVKVVTTDQSGNYVAPGVATPVALDDGSGNVITSTSSALDVNTKRVGGTLTDTNSGVKSAGTQRVVLATDQPALTNALKVDGSAVTQPIQGQSGTPTVSSVTITTSSTSVLSSNASRKFLVLCNTDTTNSIYVNLAGGTAVATNLLLGPNGGSIILDSNYIPTGAIKAIASAGTPNLSVTEG